MRITLIYGDGIGYEVIHAAKEIIDATTNEIEWEISEAGAEITTDTDKVFSCPMLLKIEPPTLEEIGKMNENAYILRAFAFE